MSDLPTSMELTDAVPPPETEVLERIDRFDLLRPLGQGGMGEVYLARDTASGELVALKRLRKDRVDATAIKDFVRESKHMFKMRHPNVLPVLHVSDGTDAPYYVMPLVASGTLSDRIAKGGPLTEAAAVDVAVQIADALGYAHEKCGVTHRDIKPGNILITPDERVYVSDFGLVRSVHGTTEAHERTVVSSWTVGTRSYMAPEVIMGNAGDARSDLYSLGAVMFESLTGRPPFVGTSLEEVLAKIKTGTRPTLVQLLPSASPDLERVIDGLLAPKLRDRYSDAKDVLNDLLRLRRREPIHGPHDASERIEPVVAPAQVPRNAQTNVAPPAKPRTRSLVPGIASGLLLAGLAAGGAWWALKQAAPAHAAAAPTSGPAVTPSTGPDGSPDDRRSRTGADGPAVPPIPPPAASPAAATINQSSASRPFESVTRAATPGLERSSSATDASNATATSGLPRQAAPPERAAVANQSPARVAADGTAQALQVVRRGDERQLATLVRTLSDDQCYAPDSDTGDTILHVAAAAGSVACLDVLVSQRKLDVNTRNAVTGRTPLHAAAFYRRPDVVARLLALGATVDATDRNGDTALNTIMHEAAPNNLSAQIVGQLLRAGADRTLRNRKDQSPEEAAHGKPLLEAALAEVKPLKR